MLSQYKPAIEKRVTQFAGNIPLSPNTVTLLGVVPALLFVYFLNAGNYAAALVVYLGSFLDFIDGAIARSQGKTSKFGGFLDSVVDRGVDFMLICAFGFAGLARWEIIVPLALVSFLISYARSRGELASGGSVIFNVGIVERTERLITIYVGFILFLLFPLVRIQTMNVLEIVFVILLILSGFTVWQRVKYAYEKLQ
ncbi:MAG: CDP-alcohol phosphatidyltransferase family protein [Microgenomates group bacterium]